MFLKKRRTDTCPFSAFHIFSYRLFGRIGVLFIHEVDDCIGKSIGKTVMYQSQFLDRIIFSVADTFIRFQRQSRLVVDCDAAFPIPIHFVQRKSDSCG